MRIIAFKKRRVFDIIFASIATLLFLFATVAVWYFVALGARDVLTIILALTLTTGFGCAVMSLITGRMEWLLIGLWELPI